MISQFNQPRGSTSIEVNKQSIARNFGVKEDEVVYFTAGIDLSGFKVIYDESTQRAYSLPSGIVSGTTAISLNEQAILTHSAGSVDLGELAVSREEYVTLPGSFDTGATLNVKNELLTHTGGKYRWDGEFPKIVPAGSSPDSTGEVKLGAWVGVGDVSLRTQLSSYGSGNGDNIVSHKQPFTGSINSTVGDKLSSILSPFDFGAVGDGVADDTDAIYAYCAAVKLAGQSVYDFAGGKYKITPASDKYTITTNVTTGPRTYVVDVAGRDGVTVKNGQFVVDLDMSLGEFTFIQANDSSNLTVSNIQGYLTARNRYESDTTLQPVNSWVKSRADTKNVHNILVTDCTFNMTHVSGSGQQGYSTAYGKLLPVFFDAQIYSTRGTLFFGYRTTLRNCLFDSCIEYALMVWGHNDVVIDNCEFRAYGGLSSLPAIRYFSFGANGLKITKCRIYANPSKPSSYTLVQVIYGTDGTGNTDNGRLPAKNIFISECAFGVNKDQSAIRIGNVDDISIVGCSFRAIGSIPEPDNSSGYSSIWVQNDLYTANTAMNLINKLVVRDCYSNRNRRFLSIANVTGAPVKHVWLTDSLAEQCYSFAVLAAWRCYAAGNIATGTGSVGVGLGCLIPTGATDPWHDYNNNNMSGFADALSVSSTGKDYLLVKNLRAIGNTNSLSTDAEYSTLRTTTYSAISGVVPRYVGELIRTTDTNKIYIAYSDTGWQLLS